MRRLPLGWRQKLAFSVALIHEPRIVFLDEPTSGVDPITRRQFWELIYEAASAGTTVLVSTHYMDEAEYCDRISIMVSGRIAAIGAPADLKRQFGVDSIDELFVRLGASAVGGAGMSALKGLLQKEAFHILRDRRTLIVLIALPVVQVVLFGFAIRTDIDGVRLAVVDSAPDYATMALRDRFASAGVFRTVSVVARTADLEPLFQNGQAQQAIVFKPGFAADLARGEPAQILIVTDATEPNTGSLLQAYAQAVIDGYQRELSASATSSGVRASRLIITPDVRVRFNPTRASSNLFVPGLMAFVLTIVSSMMTAISLTREKETGTMEAMLVSPLRPLEIIVGKVAPYLVIGFVSAIAIIVEARLVFRVPLRGSLLLLLFEAALFILVSLSLGILVSARTSSQRAGDDGRAAGNDAAERPPVRLHLSGREHAVAAADPVERRAGPMVRGDRAGHHAEGRRAGLRLARDADSRGDGRRAAGGQRALVQGTAGVAMRRILFLAQAEVLHIVRDRILVAQILVVPIVQLLILSNAATFQIRNTSIHIVDLDRTSTSRGLASHLAASGHFQIVGTAPSLDAANEGLLDGTVTMVVVIPHDFEASLVRTGVAPVELSVNGEKGSAAGIVQAYASRVLVDYAAELTARLRPSVIAAKAGMPIPLRGVPRIDVRVRGRYNPTLNYQHYMVPGILVALVTMIGTLLSAQNIAREKELGTLEQLNVTPITRGEFITAKLLPFWVLGLLELSLGLIVGKLVFGIPMVGSLLLLYGAAAVYLAVALGIGLWISTLVETQQQAMFVTFFIVIIYLLMSGLFTPIDSMAPWVQAVSQINPVRHFVTISRAILMKGAGPAAIVEPLSILAVSAVVILTLAVRQYRKRLA